MPEQVRHDGWGYELTEPLRIALAGLGTVGAGVVRLLDANAGLIARRAGRAIVVSAVSARDRHKDRGVDLARFAWEDDTGALAGRGDVDVVVDGSVEGHLKPAPRLYELLSERLDVGFADMVFLDDQSSNIRGAEALGIPSVWFDVSDPDTSFAEVRKLLGLVEGPTHG